ncbi:hypothetical protein Gohar_006819 [Gossypium harknessii]|uniref:Uncharacterized protein n=1 Tax=Gossypium harknessii TaxID=34285 RepID=A0A7J9GF97_9ROSI|nr:hypothetical protein [Gossypium harknessii]
MRFSPLYRIVDRFQDTSVPMPLTEESAGPGTFALEAKPHVVNLRNSP